MRISIALATYNGAAYLTEQLESFVAQTRRPDELVVSDDASTDGTVELLRRFRDSAPFPVVILENDDRLGYAGNFNRALELATGELVFLSDQDDVWFPEKIERMARRASSSDALVLMNDAALTGPDLDEVGLTKLGQIRSAGLPDSDFVMGSCAAIRRRLLDLALPVHPGFPAHDSWLVPMAEGMGRKDIVEEVLQYYRRHGANESQSIGNRTDRLGRIDVLRERLRVFRAEQRGAASEALRRQRLLLEGVERARDRAEAREADALEAYRRRLEDRVGALAERVAIRERSILARVPAVARLWAAGGYAHFNGPVSAIRDLFLG